MKQLIDYFERNAIAYDDLVIRKFDAYRGGILQWNEFVNLTAIKDPKEFTLKHFVDSVTCFNLEEYKKANTVLDLGTGAGFPGVPLAILSPEKEFVLVDSLNKRLKIIQELCENIGINNVKTIHGRAEDLAQNPAHRQMYDICVSRAVANLNVLFEYCLPFVNTGGYMFAYKGAGAENEINLAKNVMKKLGAGEYRLEETYIGEDAKDHRILIVKKVGKTPSKYPRKAGIPAKEPLK